MRFRCASGGGNEPARASRAYDKSRDGFVIAGGAGVVVLEELEHAKARGAKIYGEVAGYGATSDGFDMVAPSGEGAVRCMRLAMAGRIGVYTTRPMPSADASASIPAAALHSALSVRRRPGPSSSVSSPSVTSRSTPVIVA